MNKQFNTIQDIIDHMSTIPEEKWCTGIREDYQGNRCFLGHLDVALVGKTSSGVTYCEGEQVDPSIDLIKEKFPEMVTKDEWGEESFPVVEINNASENPKESVINYLKTLV